MKIGFSLVDLTLGGAQIFTLQLVSGLAKRGHIIEYFLFTDPKDLRRVSPSLLDNLKRYSTQRHMARELFSCDVIQLDGYHNLRRKIPYLRHFALCYETYHSLYSIRRSSPLFAPHRIAVSRYIQENARPPCIVIYQGVQTPILEKTPVKTYDVTILGRFHPVKNHHLFLDVCENLFNTFGHLDVLIIGSDSNQSSYSRNLQKRIDGLRNLGIRVDVIGEMQLGQIYQILQRCKILLVTSTDEGFGRMAIEAMACKLPVVANPVGGLLEIIKDKESGFLVEKDNVESFTGYVTSLLENPALITEMGQCGRDIVERNFSFTHMLDKYEEFYTKSMKA